MLGSGNGCCWHGWTDTSNTGAGAGDASSNSSSLESMSIVVNAHRPMLNLLTLEALSTCTSLLRIFKIT